MACKVIGLRRFTATPASAGTRYAAPDGSGSAFTIDAPGPVRTAISGAQPGDVVFLRGGIYSIATESIRTKINGTPTQPIIIESYPGEKAIFEGDISGGVLDDRQRVVIEGSCIRLRNVEVRNSIAYAGVWVGSQGNALYTGSDNLIEHVYSHNNIGNGIQNYGDRNRFLSCTANDNSDVGYGYPFANGGNSDGFSISRGTGVRVENCVALRNSDDGIDLWGAINGYAGRNIVGKNGLGPNGDGNGIKAGGYTPSGPNLIEHNLSFSNRAHGFDTNATTGVCFRRNTSWGNGVRGFFLYGNVVAEKNIADSDFGGSYGGGHSGIVTDNSWQRTGAVEFISTEPVSRDFLLPTVGGGFEDIGACGRRFFVRPYGR